MIQGTQATCFSAVLKHKEDMKCYQALDLDKAVTEDG